MPRRSHPTARSLVSAAPATWEDSHASCRASHRSSTAKPGYGYPDYSDQAVDRAATDLRSRRSSPFQGRPGSGRRDRADPLAWNWCRLAFPVAGAGVVGWVDVDAIHLTRVEIMQGLQGMEVVGLDQDVPGRIRRAILDTRQGDQGGKYRLAELAHHDQLVHRKSPDVAGRRCPLRSHADRNILGQPPGGPSRAALSLGPPTSRFNRPHGLESADPGRRCGRVVRQRKRVRL